MRPNRKPKKSYTLSRESVAFLEAMRKRHRARSVSSVLEEILQALRRQQERSTIDQAVARYYTSLSATEATEQAKWGEFALRDPVSPSAVGLEIPAPWRNLVCAPARRSI